MKKIYIQQKRKGNVENFIKIIIYSKSIRGEYFKSIATYKDKECTSLQCSLLKDRTLGDLYKICKTYYPNLTKRHFSNSIIQLCLNDRKFKLMYCNTVKNWILTNHVRDAKQGKIMQSYLMMYDYKRYISKRNKNKFSIKKLLQFSDYTLQDIM